MLPLSLPVDSRCNASVSNEIASTFPVVEENDRLAGMQLPQKKKRKPDSGSNEPQMISLPRSQSEKESISPANAKKQFNAEELKRYFSATPSFLSEIDSEELCFRLKEAVREGDAVLSCEALCFIEKFLTTDSDMHPRNRLRILSSFYSCILGLTMNCLESNSLDNAIYGVEVWLSIAQFERKFDLNGSELSLFRRSFSVVYPVLISLATSQRFLSASYEQGDEILAVLDAYIEISMLFTNQDCMLTSMTFVMTNIIKPEWYCKEAALNIFAFMVQYSPPYPISIVLGATPSMLIACLRDNHEKVREAAAFASHSLFVTSMHSTFLQGHDETPLVEELLRSLDDPAEDTVLQVMKAFDSIFTSLIRGNKKKSLLTVVSPLCTKLFSWCSGESSAAKRDSAYGLFDSIISCSSESDEFYGIIILYFERFVELLEWQFALKNMHQIRLLVNIFESYFYGSASYPEFDHMSLGCIDVFIEILMHLQSHQEDCQDVITRMKILAGVLFVIPRALVQLDTSDELKLTSFLSSFMEIIKNIEVSDIEVRRMLLDSLSRLSAGLSFIAIRPFCEEMFSIVLRMLNIRDNDPTSCVESVKFFNILTNIFGAESIPHIRDFLASNILNTQSPCDDPLANALLASYASAFKILKCAEEKQLLNAFRCEVINVIAFGCSQVLQRDATVVCAAMVLLCSVIDHFKGEMREVVSQGWLHEIFICQEHCGIPVQNAIEDGRRKIEEAFGKGSLPARSC